MDNKSDVYDPYELSSSLQRSPYIILLDLADDWDEVKIKYTKYLKLPPKYRRWCDYYSNELYGATITDMFNALSAKYNQEENQDDDICDAPSLVQLPSAYYENDIIGLLTLKSMNHIVLDESVNLMSDKFIEDNYGLDFDTVFNKITPYFTPDEYNKLAENYLVEELDYKEWKTALRSAIKENDEQKIIDLGWNPSVPFNENTQEFARNRQIAWFKDNAPVVVDLTNIENQLIFKEPIQEESTMITNIYKANNLYPVYIVMSYSDTLFGNVERFIKKVEYTHAGLAFNNDFSEIFTFSFGKEWNGFITDSIDMYIDNSPKAIMSVICIFVDGETRDKMYHTLNYLQDHKEKTRYGFGNLINILLNRAKKFPYPENLAMVCSQFVDMMLKLVNIDITNKSSNLVIPQDFDKACKRKAHVYKVYEGLCTRYNPNAIDRIIKMLFYKNNVDNIKYPVHPLPIKFVKESEKIAYQNIIDEINDLLTPTNLFESTSSIRITKDGDIEMPLYQYLLNEYNDSAKLLDSYEENNSEGIKKELARLFYLNTLIEEQIRKTKKRDEEFDNLIALRYLIIHDFKLNLKKVEKLDKEFNFCEYYQNSEFNMKSSDIDNITLKYSGDAIKKAMTAILRFKN